MKPRVEQFEPANVSLLQEVAGSPKLRKLVRISCDIVCVATLDIIITLKKCLFQHTYNLYCLHEVTTLQLHTCH